MGVDFVQRKSMKIRPSGRSTDFITPSFGYGCLLDCSYCYMKRHKPGKELSIAKNTATILRTIDLHVRAQPSRTPNQTDPDFWTYDLSCNEDFALHAKYHEWQRIFEFFKAHPLAKGSLATKVIPREFLTFDPDRKIRLRFSLMPQRTADYFEPNTPSIRERIEAVNEFVEAGYEVHLNFSPIILYKEWEQDYRELFHLIDQIVGPSYKQNVLAECIFLTHNQKKHQENLDKNRPQEHWLWVPHLQEAKTSQFGGENVRYRHGLKGKYIRKFRALHDEIIPWNTIRYIF